MLDLRDLECLSALARHKHFARAAEECGMSQPAFSMRIRNLEDRQVEALYTFPVPKGASVANFSMWIDGKEMVGEVGSELEQIEGPTRIPVRRVRDQLQRAVNLSLGSALSTIGLTVPVMLAISLFTGTPLKLGLNAVDIVLLSVTLFVCHITFSGAPTNILLGFVHLVLFGTYLLLIFKP